MHIHIITLSYTPNACYKTFILQYIGFIINIVQNNIVFKHVSMIGYYFK